jgi:hypothetical protein
MRRDEKWWTILDVIKNLEYLDLAFSFLLVLVDVRKNLPPNQLKSMLKIFPFVLPFLANYKVFIWLV